MKIFQVTHLSGTFSFTTEENPDAIFLSKGKAEAYINYLVTEAGFTHKEFKTTKL